MSGRDTTGKDVLDSRLQGEAGLAATLASALAAQESIERATHGFHAYPAGLHPDAARDLISAFPGESVLDPFCGGGCVLVEARIAGRIAHGRDLSSTALRVSRARTSAPSDEILTAMRGRARKITERARTNPVPPHPRIFDAVNDWYAPHAASELQALLLGIDEVEDPLVRKLLLAVFSAIVVKVSWRKSDTSARREKHRRPPGTTAILFHKKTRELARKQVALRELIPDGTPEATLDLQDARKVQVPAPVDLVLTSPPYPAVYDYLPMQHLRRIWLGAPDEEDQEREIGPRRSWRQSKRARREWVQDTHAWTKAAARTLNPGGHLVVVVGDGLTPAGPVDTVAASRDAAVAAGLTPVARASLLRPDHARDSSRWEHVFAFRKS